MLTEKIEAIEELVESEESAEKVSEVIEEIREEIGELYEDGVITTESKAELTDLLDNLQTEYALTLEPSSVDPILEDLKEKAAEVE